MAGEEGIPAADKIELAAAAASDVEKHARTLKVRKGG